MQSYLKVTTKSSCRRSTCSSSSRRSTSSSRHSAKAKPYLQLHLLGQQSVVVGLPDSEVPAGDRLVEEQRNDEEGVTKRDAEGHQTEVIAAETEPRNGAEGRVEGEPGRLQVIHPGQREPGHEPAVHERAGPAHGREADRDARCAHEGVDAERQQPLLGGARAEESVVAGRKGESVLWREVSDEAHATQEEADALAHGEPDDPLHQRRQLGPRTHLERCLCCSCLLLELLFFFTLSE